jgi:hypothetical protein
MSRSVWQALTIAAVLLGSVLAVGTARATLFQVSNRNPFALGLQIDWSIFGPAGTVLSCFCSAQTDGFTVSVNGTAGTIDRYNEGVPPYKGNFSVGDALVAQPYISDEMTVGFMANPVLGVGAQIQPLNYTGPFTGYMQVLTDDGMNALFSVSGDSTTAEDNSAPFLGVMSTTNDIIGVNFFADIGNAEFPEVGDIAINQMDVSPAPEPGTALILATAALLVIAGAGLYRRQIGFRG